MEDADFKSLDECLIARQDFKFYNVFYYTWWTSVECSFIAIFP